MQQVLPQDPNKIYVDIEKFKRGVLIVVALLVVGASLYPTVHSKAAKITCASFVNYDAALEAYTSDPVRYKALDKDHDGVPCEYLIKTHVR
jgi:uncharacterized membrane protein